VVPADGYEEISLGAVPMSVSAVAVIGSGRRCRDGAEAASDWTELPGRFDLSVEMRFGLYVARVRLAG
jgi:hypothetical protein